MPEMWCYQDGRAGRRQRGVVPFFRPYPLSRQLREGVVYGDGKMLPPPLSERLLPRRAAIALLRVGGAEGERERRRSAFVGTRKFAQSLFFFCAL